MNVALIALSDDEHPVTPPLMLAYVATVLEQRGYLVRIYDLALTPDLTPATALRPLRAFNPQLAIVSGKNSKVLEEIRQFLRAPECRVLTMRVDRDFLEVDTLCADVLAWLGQQTRAELLSEPEALAARPPSLQLDELPFPSRHLLSLEHYGLRAPGGELQTTLLIGTPGSERVTGPVLRKPAQIVGELRSVAREYGIRHYRFPGIPLNSNRDWLRELLMHLREAQPGIYWEARADVTQLDESLLLMMAQAGCEALRLDLTASQVFESKEARLHLRRVVHQAHNHNIEVYANLELEPPYEALVNLVDVAASFNLDDIKFSVRKSGSHIRPNMPDIDAERRLEAMAEQMYYAGLRRQRLVERYGSVIGGLIWRLRGTGLLKNSGPESSSSPAEPM